MPRLMRRLLVLSGGHPFEAAPFDELLASLDGWTIEHLSHPAAETAIGEGAAERADAILSYDMPGHDFTGGIANPRPPSDAFKAAIRRYFARGGGAVAMHHALAGWAAWPEWAAMLGGRFLYAPEGPLLDSGYRHDVVYEAEVVADHPVTAGLPATFPLCDELYLAEIDADVTPLLRARHDFVAANFYSAAHAVAGRMSDNEDWPHAPGRDAIGWTRAIGPGRLVYLQPGDGPATYADINVRRLLANALSWVAP